MKEVAPLNPQGLMSAFNGTDLVSFKMQREVIPKQREYSASIDKGGFTFTVRTGEVIRETIVMESKK